jgi:hypothetical protein
MASKAAQVQLPRLSQRVEISHRRKGRKGKPDMLPLTTDVRSSSDLSPGFRDRLIERLVATGLPADRRVSFVADLTGRATQTVRRWFAGSSPGLPDLRSFTRLCQELDISADEVMGLNSATTAHGGTNGGPLLEVARCVHSMACALGRQGRLGEPVMVPGDEMAPRLREGDLAFVDHESGFTGNGLYAFECQGKVIIRRVEQQLGRGWLLKCDNKAYADSEHGGVAAVRVRGLRLLGKVRGTIALRVYRGRRHHGCSRQRQQERGQLPPLVTLWLIVRPLRRGPSTPAL